MLCATVGAATFWALAGVLDAVLTLTCLQGQLTSLQPLCMRLPLLQSLNNFA